MYRLILAEALAKRCMYRSVLAKAQAKQRMYGSVLAEAPSAASLKNSRIPPVKSPPYLPLKFLPLKFLHRATRKSLNILLILHSNQSK
jgi:hypothetical protein